MTSIDYANKRPRLSGIANARYTGCPRCGRALSIAEVIERHCENCGRQTEPEEMRQTPVFPGPQPITNSDSLTPP
ncbi:hypothetical protein J2J97_05205 [Rhizobium bangladeshense]|uniref:hypothetical protein n=1 Tax=Rhizobium bangladeshense TaxID=1138189 RepID=UPI001A986CC9|nr:hypothetical protein [Rhizobium bangladeshense]MBX4932162.1 hypothetical protein [Rhizobium bangladeshense]QSY89530.1 hypothetical protein J2J98_05155 [Rhizobium bangladeshense]QSY95332.1 hypothetical protein J2J97_05205 [Rhizobium bangladeshense]